MTAPLFLYFEDQMQLHPCVYLYIYATVLLKQLFNIILCTLVTKYKVMLNFSFSHTIYP